MARQRMRGRPMAVIEPWSRVRHSLGFETVESSNRAFEANCRQMVLADGRVLRRWTRQRDDGGRIVALIEQREMHRVGFTPMGEHCPRAIFRELFRQCVPRRSVDDRSSACTGADRRRCAVHRLDQMHRARRGVAHPRSLAIVWNQLTMAAGRKMPAATTSTKWPYRGT